MPYKPKIITVRMSPEEHARYKAAALLAGLSLNQWCSAAFSEAASITESIYSPEKKDCKGEVTNVIR